jgi:hypothetical protein
MQAPDLYQRELELLGGLSPSGSPNFILWWTGNPHPNAPMLPILDSPSWALMEWHPAEDAGSPYTWPGAELGPYPSRGFYDLLQPFRNGAEPALLDSAALNLNVLRRMARFRINLKQHSLIQRRIAMRDMRDKHQQAQQDRIADALQDAMPAFGEAASYRLNPGATTALARRIEQIRANLPHTDRFSREMPRGLAQV